MCGIAGVINLRNNKIDKEIIPSLIKSIKHRGPDFDDYWVSQNQNVFLINSRLSIQDLSDNGNQPFISEDKRYVIVFNGEIYNFEDLKKNLKEFKFRSKSDTEILLKLYIKFETKCLEMIEGMYAFSIYDNLKKELFCARDPFGIKPFYYFKNENKFWFSSEIKSFFLVNKNISKNEKSILRYLNSEYHEHIEETYFNGVFKLKPGHYIKINNSGIYKKKFWDFKEKVKKSFVPKENIDKQNHLKNLIENSVKKSMISDVPISITASGGLDSSILQITAKKFNSKIKLSSWIFNEKKFSEEKYIKEISNITNLKSKTFCITPKIFLNNLKKITRINEEPFSGLPVLAYFLCLKNCTNTKVALDGSGLDEAHTGYDKYFNKNLSLQSNFFSSQDGSKSVFNNIISKKFLKKQDVSFLNEIDLPFNNNFENSKYLDLFYLKLPRALRFRDKLSMSIGKEIRPSFLNTELIATLFKLKRNDQYKHNFGKYLLRKTYEKDLSKKIVFSKKRNIQTPQTVWFRTNLSEWLDNFLKEANIWEYDWLDKENFFKNYKLFKEGKINNSFFIWKIINLEMWNNNLINSSD